MLRIIIFYFLFVIFLVSTAIAAAACDVRKVVCIRMMSAIVMKEFESQFCGHFNRDFFGPLRVELLLKHSILFVFGVD